MIDMGLQDMVQPAPGTNVVAQNTAGENGKCQARIEDIELGAGEDDWQKGITKTVRLDVRSENGEETYADIVASLNPPTPRGRRDRSNSNGAMRQNQSAAAGGIRDLGKPIEGLPRPPVRHERSDSSMTKLAMDETTRIFGLSNQKQDTHARSESKTRIHSPETPRTGRFRMQSPISRKRLRRKPSMSDLAVDTVKDNANGSQLSLVISGVQREMGGGEEESPAGFGLGIWEASEASGRISPRSPGGGRRVSHAYQNSE